MVAREFTNVPVRLRLEDVVAVVDSREQRPLNLDPLRTVVRGLDAGDYSALGLEGLIRIERKSLPDLIGSITAGRERFERELVRLRAFYYRAIVVEASWADLGRGEWRSSAPPNVVKSTICSWMLEYGVPIVPCGSRAGCADAIKRMLWTVASRRHRELLALAGHLAAVALSAAKTGDA